MLFELESRSPELEIIQAKLQSVLRRAGVDLRWEETGYVGPIRLEMGASKG